MKMNEEVKVVFESYPNIFKEKLKYLRQLILEVAADIPEIDEIEETLKWGEASYLYSKKKVGSTVRISWNKSLPDKYGMYFNCSTTLIPSFKSIFPDVFLYQGNRGITF